MKDKYISSTLTPIYLKLKFSGMEIYKCNLHYKRNLSCIDTKSSRYETTANICEDMCM